MLSAATNSHFNQVVLTVMNQHHNTPAVQPPLLLYLAPQPPYTRPLPIDTSRTKVQTISWVKNKILDCGFKMAQRKTCYSLLSPSDWQDALSHADIEDMYLVLQSDFSSSRSRAARFIKQTGVFFSFFFHPKSHHRVCTRTCQRKHASECTMVIRKVVPVPTNDNVTYSPISSGKLHRRQAIWKKFPVIDTVMHYAKQSVSRTVPIWHVWTSMWTKYDVTKTWKYYSLTAYSREKAMEVT